MSIKGELSAFLGIAKGRRVVIVGIGNSMRHDDFVGLKVIELLSVMKIENVLLLLTETVPESYTGSIRSYEPTHVILLDAANFGGSPGEARIVSPKTIVNISVSTHSLPLDVFMGYISQTICEKVVLVGIQGLDVELGEGLTPGVEKGAHDLAKILQELLTK